MSGDVAQVALGGATDDARRVTQQVQFITRPDGGRLYAALTLPVGSEPSAVVLFCPPTFDEHSRAYPIMREYARALAARGIGTLRFDYFATGDSAGTSDQFTMSSAVGDVAFLLSWLGTRFPGVRIVPMAVRMGARLLLDAIVGQAGAALAGRLTAPVLWDPVVDVRSYVFNELRATLSGALMVYGGQVVTREEIVKETLETGFCERRGYKLNQVDGYPVTRELLREVGLATETPEPWSYAEPVNVVITVRGATAAERPRTQLAALLPKMEFRSNEDIPYWNQQPLYRQTRDKLFAIVDEFVTRCLS